MTLDEFKHELKGNIKIDPWGYSMSAFFQVCDHLYDRGEDIPHEWGFKAGIGGASPDKEDEYFDLFNDSASNELLTLGHYLQRLTTILKAKGLDY